MHMLPSFSSLATLGSVLGRVNLATPYLTHATQKEYANTVSPHRLTEKVTLELNHMLLLLGQVLRQSQVSIAVLPRISYGLFLATPIILAIGYLGHPNDSEPVRTATKVFNTLYWIASIASAVALIVFGNVAFGAASLAILTLDFVVSQFLREDDHSTVKKCCDYARLVLALTSFGIFGANILMSADLYKKIAFLATVALMILSRIHFPRSVSEEVEYPKKSGGNGGFSARIQEVPAAVLPAYRGEGKSSMTRRGETPDDFFEIDSYAANADQSAPSGAPAPAAFSVPPPASA